MEQSGQKLGWLGFGAGLSEPMRCARGKIGGLVQDAHGMSKPLTLALILILCATWLLLSGYFKVQLLLLGLLSVAVVTWLAVRLRVLTHRGQPLYFRPFRLLNYWRWLLVEIMRSNIGVVRRVLSPSMNLNPAIGAVDATPDSELGDVIYANSITLTPGTTAISFTPDGQVLVHALDASSLAGLAEGAMARQVARIEPDITARTPSGRILPGRSR